MKKIFLFMILFIATQLFATNYYFSNDGDNSNTGLSDGQAWELISKIQSSSASFLNRGDSIFFNRGDTWIMDDQGFGATKYWIIGSEYDGVYVGAYGTGNDPIFTINNDVAGWSHVYFGAGASVASGTVVENLHFTWGVERTTHSISIIGHDTYEPDSLEIKNCYFDMSNLTKSATGDYPTYKQEGLSIHGDHVWLHHNTIIGDSVYSRHGIYISGDYPLIEDNYIEGFGVSGIKHQGGPHSYRGYSVGYYGIIRRNTVVDCMYGIQIAQCRWDDVYSNLVILRAGAADNSGDGLDQGLIYFGYAASDNVVAHNTLISNGDDQANNTAYGVAWQYYDHVNDQFLNNIVYEYNGVSGAHLFNANEYTAGDVDSIIFADGNLYYASNAYKWGQNGTGYSTLSGWQGASLSFPGHEDNSLTGNPMFYNHTEDSVTPEDYELTSSSPAIGEAVTVAWNNITTWTDFYDNEAVDVADIGAFEYIDAEPPELPSASIFYVDWTNGNDNWDGLSQTYTSGLNGPWKSYKNFNTGTVHASIDPGDKILFKRGETWKRSEYLTYNPGASYSGSWRPSDMSYVTFGAYGTKTGSGKTENRPVIDADNDILYLSAMHAGFNGAIDHILVRDIKFTNSTPKTTKGYIVTCWDGGGDGTGVEHWTFKNCLFDASNLNGTTYSSTTTKETLSWNGNYFWVDSCYFYGNETGDNVLVRHAVYSGMSGAIYTNNYAQDFGVSGYKFNGDNSSYGYATGNIAVDCNSNFFVGDADHIDIYGNISIITNLGVGTTQNHFRIEDNERFVDGSKPHDINIVHNTFISHDGVVDADYEYRKSGYITSNDIFDDWGGPTNAQDNIVIKNNIFYKYNVENISEFVYMHQGVNHPSDADFNIYYSDDTFIFNNNGTYDYSVADWRSTPNAPTGFEANSIQSSTDNIFASVPADNTLDPDDFIIDDAGIAYNAGIDIALHNGQSLTDYYGNPYLTKDIGGIAIQTERAGLWGWWMDGDPLPVGHTDYYISWTYGDDANAGTSITAPKKSYAFINDAGSTTFDRGTHFRFLYGDEWNRTDEPNYSSGNRAGTFVPSYMDGCTFDAYSYTYSGDVRDESDGKPTFDAEGVEFSPVKSQGAMYLGGKSYSGVQTRNTFRNLKFKTSVPIDQADYIANGNSALYIGSLGGATNTSDSTRIVNCEIDLTGLTYYKHECFGVNGDHTVWDSNYVYGNGIGGDYGTRQGIYMGGDDQTIRFNIVKDFYEAGIKMNDNSSNVDGRWSNIYGNLIIDAGIGIRVGETNHINAFSNIIIMTSNEAGWGKGMQFNAETYPGAGDSGPRQNKFYNNTIIMNGAATPYSNHFAGIDWAHAGYNETPNWSTYEDNESANNIVYIYNEGVGDLARFFYIDDGVNYPVPSDNNLFYTSGNWNAFWDAADGGAGSYSDDYSSWRTDTGNETNSTVENPLFVNHYTDSEDPESYAVSSTSPARSGAKSITLWDNVPLTDFYGFLMSPGMRGAVSFGTSSSEVTRYYINSSTGNDTNDGKSRANAWESWDNINGINGSLLNPGDTVSFYVGLTYSTATGATDNWDVSNCNNIVFNTYGTGSKPNIDGIDDHAVALGASARADYIKFVGLKFSNSSASSNTLFTNSTNGGSGVIVDSCEFDGTNNTYDLFSRLEIGTTITNSYFHDGARYAIHLAGRNNIIENNIFEDIHTNGVNGVGIRLVDNGDKPADNSLIKNNKFINCTNAIDLMGVDSVGIYYNSIAMTSTFTPASTDTIRGIVLSNDQTPTNNVKIYHNSISLRGNTANTVDLLIRQGAGANVDVKNNIFSNYDEDTDKIIETQNASTAMPTFSYNLHYSDDAYWYNLNTTSENYYSFATWYATTYEGAYTINHDPLFTSETTGDLSLTSSSQAIDNGATGLVDWYGVSVSVYDILGNSMDGIPDIGAYERQGENPPVADFNANDITPSTAQTVTFTDLSTNTPTSWTWTFDPTSITYMDATSSSSQNPHVKFNSATTYTCSLYVTNSAGNDEEIKTSYITAYTPAPPVAAFSADDTTPTTAQTVVFTDASTNSPTSWLWTFDPTTISYMSGSAITQNPQVRFNEVDDYTVTLRATNSDGYDDETKTDYISASAAGSAPVSAFSADDVTPTTSQTVVFTDASTNTPTSWLWTFDPTSVTYMSGSSTSQNPQVKFNTATTYTCTLRATNAIGYDDEIKTSYITANTPTTYDRYYVSNDGDDTYNGLFPTYVSGTDGPWETIGKVDGFTFTANDTISFEWDSWWSYTDILDLEQDRLYLNTYGSGTTEPTISGLATNRIIDISTGSSGITIDGLRFVQPVNAVIYGAYSGGDTLTVINCVFDSCETGNAISLYNTSNHYIAYNTFIFSDEVGVYLAGAYNSIVEYNTFETGWSYLAMRTAYSSRDADDNIFRYNIVNSIAWLMYVGNGDNNQIYYNIMTHTLRGVYIHLSTSAPTNTKIFNNTFGDQYSASDSYAGIYFNSDATGSGTQIFNNIFYQTISLAQLYEAESGATMPTFKNNIYYNDVGTIEVDWAGTTYTDSASWDTFSSEANFFWGTDPGLEDHDNDDYTLADSTSLAVDAGSTHTVTKDYDGDKVPSNTDIDIGAYEYQFPSPVAAFSADDTTPTTVQTVVFTDASTNTPTSWLWTFDPTSVTYMSGSSTSENPQVKFNTATTYTCTLRATNTYGYGEEIKVDYITVSAGTTPPVAAFSADDTTPTTLETVIFTDASTNTPTSWLWTIVPTTFTYISGSSVSQNPQIRFDIAGTYDITLRATNAGGYDDEIKASYITASLGTVPPVSAFVADDVTPTTLQTVGLTDESTNTPISWLWTFAPTSVTYISGTSASQNPDVRFDAATTYTVTLRATNAGGFDDEIKTDYITASLGVTPPVAAFIIDDQTPTTIQTTVFTDQSTNTPTSWLWTFAPTSVTFMEGTSSASQHPEVRFDVAATYNITLRATNAGGYDDEIKSGYVIASLPNYPPTAEFSANDLTPYTDQVVIFTDESTNGPTAWTWTFSPTTVTYADGTNSSSRNPHVTFDNAATYTCSLYVTNAFGNDEEIKVNYIVSSESTANYVMAVNSVPVLSWDKNQLDNVDDHLLAKNNPHVVTLSQLNLTGFDDVEFNALTLNDSIRIYGNAYLHGNIGTPQGYANYFFGAGNFASAVTTNQLNTVFGINNAPSVNSTHEYQNIIFGSYNVFSNTSQTYHNLIYGSYNLYNIDGIAYFNNIGGHRILYNITTQATHNNIWGYQMAEDLTGSAVNNVMIGRNALDGVGLMSQADIIVLGNAVFGGATSSSLSYSIGIGYRAGAGTRFNNTAIFGRDGFPTQHQQVVIGSPYYVGGILLDGSIRQPTGKFFINDFTSGWAGSGFILDNNYTYTGKSYLEVDQLTVRGTMSVYELLIRQIRATNGSLFVSASAKVESVDGTDIYFEDPSGHNVCPFAEGDLVIVQRVNLNNTSTIRLVEATITDVYGSIVQVSYNTGTALPGDEFVRIGNDGTTANRQGSIYLSSDDTNSPFMDVLDGVSSWADWGSSAKTKVRLGNITGMPGVVGTKYGLWSSDVYLTGNITATSGAIGGFDIFANFISANDMELYSGAYPYMNFGTLNDFFQGDAQSIDQGTGGIRIGKKGTYWYLEAGIDTGQDFFSYSTDYGLKIKGNITATSGAIGAWSIDGTYLWTGTRQTSDNYSTDGITLGDGVFRSLEFYIANDGSAHFKGAVTGATITGGTIQTNFGTNGKITISSGSLKFYADIASGSNVATIYPFVGTDAKSIYLDGKLYFGWDGTPPGNSMPDYTFIGTNNINMTNGTGVSTNNSGYYDEMDLTELGLEFIYHDYNNLSSSNYKRIKISATGGIEFAENSDTYDINLYRGGINILKTDDNFEADDITAEGDLYMEGMSVLDIPTNSGDLGTLITINMTGISYYEIDVATDPASITTLTGGVEGQELLIVCVDAGADDITFVDNTGNMLLSGNFVFGEGDILELVYNADLAKWCERNRSNN